MFVRGPDSSLLGLVFEGKVIVLRTATERFINNVIKRALDREEPLIWEDWRGEHIVIFRNMVGEFIRNSLGDYSITEITDIMENMTVEHEMEHIDNAAGIIAPAIQVILVDVVSRARGIIKGLNWSAAVLTDEVNSRLSLYAALYPQIELLKELYLMSSAAVSSFGYLASAILIREITGVDFTAGISRDGRQIEGLNIYFGEILRSGNIPAALKQKISGIRPRLFANTRPADNSHFHDLQAGFNRWRRRQQRNNPVQ